MDELVFAEATKAVDPYQNLVNTLSTFFSQLTNPTRLLAWWYPPGSSEHLVVYTPYLFILNVLPAALAILGIILAVNVARKIFKKISR